MKKSDMINEIFANVRWSEQSKVNNAKAAMKKSKAYIEHVYSSYSGDKDNALFYATLISC